MNKFAAIFLTVSLLFLAACDRVPPGHVGVKVYELGTEKGIDNEVLGTGRYWISWNESLHLFPTFTQNYVWTADPAEGSPNDESIAFQTREGLKVSADVGISYNINPDKVSTVFQKYRRGIEEVTDTYIRNMVRDSLVKRSSVLAIESVYGEGKASLIGDVQADVAEQVREFGINIEKIYWIGELRLPETVTNSINAKIGATQKALLRQNEVAEATAEAEKERERAKGIADGKLLIAEAEAQALREKAQALAENPDLLQLMAIEKWNGVLPTMTSGATPFINVKPPQGVSK